MPAELDACLAAILGQGGDAVVVVPKALWAGLRARLEEAGVEVVRVDRAPVLSKETLLHAIYQACQLPAWFGFNWDALVDALSDWGEGPGTRLLLFGDFDLLEQRAPEVARTFLDVVRQARDERRASLRLVRLA
jgi:RNAse (barnase) inhibitor barstar